MVSWPSTLNLFKDISNFFENKKKQAFKSEDNGTKVKTVLESFCNSYLGAGSYELLDKVEYNYKDNSLLIVASNKILANELSIRLQDLSNFFKKNIIKLEKILIR